MAENTMSDALVGAQPPSVSRRSVLVGGGIGALSVAVAGSRVHAVGGGGGGGQHAFAMVTDTHVNVQEPDRTAALERILADIVDRDPAFVLNCGDITDLGAADEFARYTDIIPDELQGKMKEVPGNHENQYLVDALEAYDEHLEARRYSFASGGLHVIGLDPLVMMEWGWYFDAELLNWLRQELRQVPHGTPIVLFLHFPMSTDWNYVQNDHELLSLIEPYPVRAIFAGHRHVTNVSTFNGATQVMGNSLKNGPYYYWIEESEGEDGPVLEVTEVTVPDDGDVTEEKLTAISLTGPGRDALGPVRARAVADHSAVDLRVDVPHRAAVAAVQARPYPLAYGKIEGGWTELEQSDRPARRWTGQVDVADLPPGRHKLELRVLGENEDRYDDVVEFELPVASTRIGWSTSLEGRIQGGLASRDGLVVAATTKGEVAAFRPTYRAVRPEWRSRIGPVYRAPVFTPDGDTLLVPSSDHHLYGLDPVNGHARWSVDLGAPLAGDLAIAAVDDEPRIFLSIGEQLACLDLTGQVQWTAELNGIYAGRPECDGDRVYAGSGDGNAYAFDARTGEEVWRHQLTDKDDRYGTVLYGPWACSVRILADGAVLFTRFSNAVALEAATGEQVWLGEGDDLELQQVVYTPPTLTDQGILLLDGFSGSVHLFDPDNGRQIWSADAVPRNFGAQPVPSPDEDGVYWLVAQSGVLARIDLNEESAEQVLQVLTCYTQSTAAITGSGDEQVLVVGGQDGVLYGVVDLQS